MFGVETIKLPVENSRLFHYKKISISRLLKEIDQLLKESSFLDSDILYKQLLIPEDLKIKGDLDLFKEQEVYNYINNCKISQSSKIRLCNVYLGNKYIFNHKNIDIDTMNGLYTMISNNIIDKNDESMGEYYRIKREFIANISSPFSDFTETVKPYNVINYMEELINYINNNNDMDDMELFIKSQVISIYFLYVHPYLDTNGRYSRLLSSWFLINNNNSKYLLFNKVIYNDKNNYIKSVKKSIETRNITHYLLFILKGLKDEIRKQNIINDINRNNKLSIEDIQIIDSFLSLKNDKIKIKDLVLKYNNYDPRIEDKNIIDSIIRLVGSNIFTMDNDNNILLNNEIKCNERRL